MGATAEWRAARAASRAEGLSTGAVVCAIATDGQSRGAVNGLRTAGGRVVGLLGRDPLESLAWAGAEDVNAAYADPLALLAAEVELVCLDGDVTDLLAPLVRAGCAVLLSVPQGPAADELRLVVEQADLAEQAHAVAFPSRADLAFRAAEHERPHLGLVDQVTVLAWPSGRASRTDLVDLVQRWGGPVVAVTAHGPSLPAPDLAGTPVTLALLTESGATVLVAEVYGAQLSAATLTVRGSTGRLVVDESGVHAQIGRGAAAEVRGRLLGRGTDASGLGVAGHELLRAVALGDTVLPHAGSLRDLLVATRVVEAVEESRRVRGWVEL